MSRVVEALVSALGTGKVLVDESSRKERRHDYWFLSQLDDEQDRAAPAPLCVVRPAAVDDVVAVVNACRENGTPLVPFGLGSGVCGGVMTTQESVVLDLGSMSRVRGIDPINLVASFDAGVRGTDAEEAARARGLTLGHFPQSIALSSVGGWVATRAAGQLSTGYGNIEDLVLDLEVVLPNGRVLHTKRTPRAAAGPDLRHLFLGSEGTLGVVTGVSLSARRAAERTAESAFHVRSLTEGFELQRDIVQSGWLPVVMRQYDRIEAERHFGSWVRAGQNMLILVHEGPASRVEAEVAAVKKIAEAHGVLEAPAECVRHWLESRNRVPDFKSFIENGVVVDTIEIAAPWDKIADIYASAVSSLGEVEGMLSASGHSSHVYRSGINLYFTFAAQPPSRDKMRSTYLECWRRVMRATMDGGGGVSHHHGIGRVRRDYLESDLGESGVWLLRTLKQALDPNGFMNPGALIPDA